MTTRESRAAFTPRHMTMKGKRVVVLEEADFARLLKQADQWEPAMPEPDA